MGNEIKIKRYLDIYIDTETCNFRCHYCYIFLTNRFGNKLFKLQHSPEEIRKALSRTRLGGTCLINLCAGGETLLSPDVIPVAKALIDEGHYVMIVTNGSCTKRFKEIRDSFTPEECAHLFFKFSFHYLELLRLNIMDKYFENVKMMHKAGCSFTVELTPNDELLDKIDDIKKCCLDNIGALPHLTIARDDRTGGINHLSEKLDWDAYKKTWGVFDSALFDFKKQIFYVKRKEFCYAGDYSMLINLSSGDYTPCNCGCKIGNIYDNKPLNFSAIGHCLLPHCFNGHFWLAFGNISYKELSKSVNITTFAAERDRIMTNGEHWLKPSFQQVFSTNASQTNKEYNILRKRVCKFKTQVYGFFKKNNFQHKISWLKQFSKLFFTFSFKRVILIGSPEHGNLGDHAISISERRLLKQNNIRCAEISGKLYNKWKNLIKPFIKNSDVVCITGGGFLGSLWKAGDDMVNDIILSFPNNRIVIFPQTIYFENEQDKKIFVEIYSKHKDLHLFLREKNSYTLAQKLLQNKCNIYLVPDIALSLDTSDIQTKRQNIVLLCLREDIESVLGYETQSSIKKFAAETMHAVKYITTIAPHPILLEERDCEVKNFLTEIKSSRLVITDRLHAMVFAYITQTPCYVFDNLSHKVSGVYEWIKDCGFIKFITDVSEIKISENVSVNNAELKNWEEIIKVIKK